MTPHPRSVRGAREEEREKEGKREDRERRESMLGGRSYRMFLLLTSSV